MISIPIMAEDYEAIRATLPHAAESWPVQTDDRGLMRLWLDRPSSTGSGRCAGRESYSDVILRLAAANP